MLVWRNFFVALQLKNCHITNIINHDLHNVYSSNTEEGHRIRNVLVKYFNEVLTQK